MLIGLWDQIDSAVLSAALVNFHLFLVLHVVLLRKNPGGSAPKIIVSSLLFCLAGTALTYGAWSMIRLAPAGYRVWALFTAGAVSLFLYLFLVFHYITWFFGMGEAAIRIRLVCELERAGDKGVSLDAIYKEYNAEKILEVRLRRLLRSGHLEFDGERYRLKNPILLAQVYLTRAVKGLLGV